MKGIMIEMLKKGMKVLKKLSLIGMSMLMVISIIQSHFLQVDAASSKVTVTTEKKYNYGTYSMGSSSWATQKYEVTIDGSTTNAFCLEPDKKAPSSGEYEKNVLDVSSDVAKVLYYGWYATGDNNYWTNHYKTLSYGQKYIAVHMAVAKADGNYWDYKANSYGKTVAESLYKWCISKGDIPGKNGVYFQNSGKIVSQLTKNTASSAQEYFEALGIDTSVSSHLRTTNRISRGVSLRSYSDEQNITIKLPKGVACIVLKNDGTYAYQKYHDAGSSWNISSSSTGEYVYVFELVDEASYNNLTDSQKDITITGSSVTTSLKAYTLRKSGATQDLACIVENKEKAEASLSLEWGDAYPLKLYLTKDDEYGNDVAGAKISIGTGKSNGKVTGVFQTITTDKDGEGVFELDYIADVSGNSAKTYYVQEVEAPTNYILDDTIYTVKVEPGATSPSPKKIKITDEHQTGSVKISKTDSVTHKKIGGVALKIVNTSTITFYKVDEKDFEIDPDLENYDLPDGYIQDNSDLADSTKENPIVKKAGEFEYAFITEAGKDTVIDNLPIGTYKVVELSNADGYKEVGDDYVLSTFTISYDSLNAQLGLNASTVETNGSNTALTGEITLNKVDKDTGSTNSLGDGKLVGTEFTLYAKEDILDPSDGTVVFKKDSVISRQTVGNGVFGDIGTKSIGNDNTLTWTNLLLGEYYIKETKACDGYILNEASQNIVLSKDNLKDSKSSIVKKSITVSNQVIRGSIQLTKRDSKTKEIVTDNSKSATFVIRNVNDMWIDDQNHQPIFYKANSIIETLTTKDGVVTSSSLPYGQYIITETSAPAEYIRDGENVAVNGKSVNVIQDELGPSVIISIDSNDKTYEITYDDTPKVGSVTLTKVLEQTELSKIKDDGYSYNGDATIENASYTLYALEDIDNPATGEILFYKDEVISKKTVGTSSWGDQGVQKTNSQGFISWSNLPMGKYYILETDTSIGCLIDKTKHEFELKETKANEKEVIKVSEEDMISTELIKQQKISIFKEGIANDTTQVYGKVDGLNGAQFTIKLLSDIEEIAGDSKENVSLEKWNEAFEKAPTYEIVTTSTDENGNKGYASTQPLAFGTYYMKETKTPEGYLQSPDCTFTVTNDQIHVNESDSEKANEQHITFNDEIYEAYVRITKKDNTEVIDNDTTKVNNKIVSLNQATFKIKNVDTNEYVKQKIGLFYFDKFTTNAQNKIIPALTGGYFTNIDEALGTITTPLKLPYGHYVIEEVSSPEGFVKLDSPVEINIASDQLTWDITTVNNDIVYDVVINNEQPTGSLTIEKSIQTDENVDYSYLLDHKENEDLSSISFKLIASEDIIDYSDGSLFYQKGDTVFEKNLSKDGTLSVNKIPMGKYILVETQTLPSCTLSSKEYEVNFIKEDDTTKVYTVEMSKNNDNEIINTPTYTKIKKTDITEEKEVVGALLQVKDIDGNIIDEWVSQKEEHIIEGLHRGETYILHEEASADGYVKVSDIQFKVDNNNDVNKVIMKDTQVTAYKLDDKDNHVIGATIQVIDKETNEIVDTWISDKTDHKVSNLVAGKTYIMQEVKTPEGYVKANDIEFTALSEEDVEVKMIDKKVVFSKQNIAGDEIEGASMNVTDSDGNIIDEWISSKEVHEINNLVVGQTYTLHETVAPDGYVLANDFEFTVNDDGNNQIVKMLDKQVLVSKTDVSGVNEIEGAKMSVTDSQGKVVDEWVSSLQKHAISQLVEGETYTLTETTCPDGYVKAESIEFTVSFDKVNQYITMKDKVVTVTKYDITNKEELEGATIEVIDKETNKIVDQWISTKESHSVNHLEEGKTYILKEITAPYGYDLCESIEFTVLGEDENGVKVDDHYDMYDSPILNDIKVYKKDRDSNQLILNKDFEFSLYSDENCTQLIETVQANTKEGTVIFKDYQYGTYYVKETKAPQGYQLSNEVKEVVIDENVNDVYSLTYFNSLNDVTVSKVKTNDSMNLNIYILLIGCVIIYVIYSYKKKNE
jgi:uncharacterized surface anchored protein